MIRLATQLRGDRRSKVDAAIRQIEVVNQSGYLKWEFETDYGLPRAIGQCQLVIMAWRSQLGFKIEPTAVGDPLAKLPPPP